MLPFTCGARNLRHIRSALKFSSKLSKTAERAHAQVKHARTISILGVADSQCLNKKIQDVLNKNEVKAFSTPSLSSACSSIILLTSDGGTNLLTLAVGAGDDDEVTTSAGKKRKHWILYSIKR